MNHKKLHQTHRHLTFIFTGVVFIIIIFIGLVFLAANYVSENRNQKKDIYAQAQIISVGAQRDDAFFTKYARGRIIEEVKKFRPHDVREGKEGGAKLSFLVLDSENNLIFKEIVQEPRFDEIKFETNKIYTDDYTYILVQDLGDKKIIFYQNIRYAVHKVGEDLLLLILLAALLSGAVYIVGYRFVEKALAPVEKNLQDMTDFVHNAGHELKTPLAVMRGNLQVMQAENKLDKKLLKKSLTEIDTTNSLLEGLIELSQVGNLSEKLSLALATQVKKVVSELEFFSKEKEVKIYNEAQGGYIIRANTQELHILLVNLVKNAIKYNKKGGEVRLTLSKNILMISDTGRGISSLEKEKIFDRFYQGDNSRSHEGFGIGLSLVKKIADANNWQIVLESEEGVGSSFRIVF